MKTPLTVLAVAAKALLLAALTFGLVPVLAMAIYYAWIRLRARRYRRVVDAEERGRE